MKISKILARLRESMSASRLVEISRSGVEMFPLVGVVRAVDKWVLIATVSRQFQAQGFDIVRLRDIDRVTAPATESLIRKISESAGSALDRTPAVDFDLRSNRDLALSVYHAEVFTGIFTYNHESGHEVDAYPGRIREIRNRIVALDRLSADGRWDTSPLSLPFSAIARYSFDSVRLRTFELFGDPYPGEPAAAVDLSAQLPASGPSAAAAQESDAASSGSELGDFLGGLRRR